MFVFWSSSVKELVVECCHTELISQKEMTQANDVYVYRWPDPSGLNPLKVLSMLVLSWRRVTRRVYVIDCLTVTGAAALWRLATWIL